MGLYIFSLFTSLAHPITISLKLVCYLKCERSIVEQSFLDIWRLVFSALSPSITSVYVGLNALINLATLLTDDG